MELDDFKSAWQTLDQRLDRQNALQWELLRERRLDSARASLRPLVWGQILQMLFGLAFILLAVRLWRTMPGDIGTILAGITVHAYGVACVFMGGVVLAGIRKIEYDAPVLEIQKNLACVRRAYVLGGMVLGLPWWFLWVPVLMVITGIGGVDLASRAPSVIWIGLAVGAIGLGVTWLVQRQAFSEPGSRCARWLEAAVTGRSLRRAQAQVEELRRFEQE